MPGAAEKADLYYVQEPPRTAERDGESWNSCGNQRLRGPPGPGVSNDIEDEDNERECNMTTIEKTKVIPFDIESFRSRKPKPSEDVADGITDDSSDQGKILEFGVAPRKAVTSRAGSPAVSVVVVTSDEELRQELANQLDGSFGVELLAATDDPIMAVAFALGMSPEVAIVGIDPGHEQLWIKTADAIREASPETWIVVIASDTETEYIEDKISRDAGGWSYLLRRNAEDSDSLMRAIDGAHGVL